jgi:hypothetical protein
MAGPQDIQRFPRGLIDLLGMRATGETPHTLGQSTQAVLNVDWLYTFDRLQFRTFSATSPTNADGLFLGTPTASPQPGFMWMVFDASFYTPVAVAAGATVQLGFGVRNPGNVFLIMENLVSPLLAAGQGTMHANHFERPFLMQAGDFFGWRVRGVTGVPAITPEATVSFVEIAV